MNNNVISQIIYKIIKEFCSKLPEEEIEKYSSKLEKLYFCHVNKVKIEPLILKYYKINDQGESYPLSYHQYNFVKNLEVILKNQSQLSLKEVADLMEKIINSNIDSYHGTFEIILESRPDTSIDSIVNFVKEIVSDTQGNLSTKLGSFIGSKIFKIILELHPENSLEEIGKQFTEIVSPYPLNIISQENEKALHEIHELCTERNTEKMQEFDWHSFDLDKDSAEVLKVLLQYCINQSIDQANRQVLDNAYDEFDRSESTKEMQKSKNNYDLDPDDAEVPNDIWHFM